jgi:hypothetical protein
MNSIFLITPKKTGSIWAFTDPERGLVNEPFVAFPGSQTVFERRSPDFDGWWYQWEQHGIEGWLCPAMFKFFPEAPQKIHLKVEPISV